MEVQVASSLGFNSSGTLYSPVAINALASSGFRAKLCLSRQDRTIVKQLISEPFFLVWMCHSQRSLNPIVINRRFWARNESGAIGRLRSEIDMVFPVAQPILLPYSVLLLRSHWRMTSTSHFMPISSLHPFIKVILELLGNFCSLNDCRSWTRCVFFRDCTTEAAVFLPVP